MLPKEDKSKYITIDDYISLFSTDVQAILQKLRQTIKDNAPDATEKISYQMPTFYLHGNLIHFGAFKNHIGIYPAPSAISAFQDEFEKYKKSKGTIQFPLDEPLPYDLVAKIVKFRVLENIEKKKNRKK